MPLSHMLEICPRGEVGKSLFFFLFLQRLPKMLRSHLNDTKKDLSKLAIETDHKWALHSNDNHGAVNKVERSLLIILQRHKRKPRFAVWRSSWDLDVLG
jgi:hypothetical protein